RIVLWIFDAVAIVKRGFDALGGRTLRAEHALGEEAGPDERYLEPRGCVVLDKVDGASAREEGADDIDTEARNLRQQRLEVGLRKFEGERLHDLSAVGFETLLESFAGFRAGGIIPSDPDGLLDATLADRDAHAVGRLPIRERRAEHVLGAQVARHRDCSG